MILPIIYVDDPILRKVAEPIQDKKELKRYTKLITDMLQTRKQHQAWGLAAPQVGVSKRIVVTNIAFPLVWVNPQLVLSEDKHAPMFESCLSIPGKAVKVARSKEVLVSYWDLHGGEHVESVTSDLAVVLQHEVDHLNGILITDYEEQNDQGTA